MKHEWDYQAGGKTSVKIHNAPGGNSQWSIGWGSDQPEPTQNQKKQYQDKQQTYQTSYQKNAYDGYYGQATSENVQYAGSTNKQTDQQYGKKGGASYQPTYQQKNDYDYDRRERGSDEKTSVKVHAPPGGKSSISFGFEEAPSYKKPALKQYDMNQDSYSRQQDKFSYQPQQQSKKDLYQNNVFNVPTQGKYGMSQPKQQQEYDQQYPPAKKQQAFGKPSNSGFNQDQDPIFGGRHYQQQQQQQQYQNSYDKYSPQRQQQQQKQQFNGFSPNPAFEDLPIFGQRVQAGQNSGPTTEKSSVKLHAPPGGKSSITFF